MVETLKSWKVALSALANARFMIKCAKDRDFKAVLLNGGAKFSQIYC